MTDGAIAFLLGGGVGVFAGMALTILLLASVDRGG